MNLRVLDQRPRLAGLLAGIMLALHAIVAIWGASRQGVTADEVLYVTGGHYANRHGDFRIQPENGILPQRLHGLAAAWTGAPTPALEGNDYWRLSSNLVNCHQFFYETGHDHFPMLMIARGLNTLFSIGAGLLVLGWAWRLGGAFAGLCALALYAADPNVLAHAALATSDMAAVFFLLASASAFHWQLAAPSARRLALSAVTFGLACVAKYSAVLLIPVFLLLLGWRHARHAGERRGSLRRIAGMAGAHAAAAVGVIWLFYGFRYSGFSPDLPPADHYSAPWDQVIPYVGWQGTVVDALARAKLLPEAFLYGYSWVLQSARARAAFLAGDYSVFGWVSFFPLAFAWKTTLALLAGLGGATLALARRWRAKRIWAADTERVAPLLVFGLVYGLVSLASHLNIGHRHILPLYPALFVAVGTWLGTLAAATPRAILAAGVLGGHVAAAALVAPNFLTFFNRLAGGPAHGYRLLVDSSLDWGQGLPALRDWLHDDPEVRAGTPVFLSYFGSDQPRYHGIRATSLPFVNGFKFPHLWYELQPGIYCIGATMLQQVYGTGAWTPALEAEYRELRPLERSLRAYFTEPARREELLARAPAEAWARSWLRFDAVRFARLCAHLRQREPDAQAGHSILIYRVTAAELDAALDR